METSVKRLFLTVALVVSIGSMPAFAQKYEFHPYAGGQMMTDYKKALDFKNPAIFGLKGDVALTDNFSIEGNGGYMNQFNFRGYSYRSHAWLYEVAGNYNFHRVNYRGVVPFASLGIGGLTVDIMSSVNQTDHNEAVYAMPLAEPIRKGPILQTTTPFVISQGDTFFNFSYGGGVKGQRLWGPMGLRADFRGRTMPNFFNAKVHGFEATAGLLFSFGER